MKLYKTNIKPLLDENKEELKDKLLIELRRVNATIATGENQSKQPLKRAKHIFEVSTAIDNLSSRAPLQLDDITKTVQDIKTGILIQSKSNFPEQAKKIDTKFSRLSLVLKESENALKQLNNEFNNYKNNSTTDYSTLTKAIDLINNNHAEIQVLADKFLNEIKSLSKSYVKILKDMKATYSVVVKRESWNGNSDYSNPYTISFYRTISPEVYEFIQNSTIETIAEIHPGWTGVKFQNHIGNIWNKLEIDPIEKWAPRQYRHDSASFWFDSWDIKYFHKYTIVEDDQQHDTEWEPVSEDVYEENFEFLGMALLTKPFGKFEEEADTKASPPGMGFVGNPQYGKWEKDNNGNSFWGWYGRYALFSNLLFYSTMGPIRYGTWNRYNTGYRGRRPFFGSTTGGSAMFGTHGTYTKQSPRFRNTSFARTGGFKRSAPSVRGASSSVRGGGPKSKGK